MSKRVLVTGSRDWVDYAIIATALTEHMDAGDTLVHGACQGADRIADYLWRTGDGGVHLTGFVERHPAHWTTYGKAAGPIRNQRMVDSGIDLCLAFIRNDSRGATDCLMRASSAGIPNVVYRRDENA